MDLSQNCTKRRIKSTSLSVLFYAKRSRTTIRQTIPIYIRITINGKRMEITTNRFVQFNQWSVTKAKVKGNSREADEINTYLDYLKNKVYGFEQDIFREEKELSIRTMKEKWYAIGEPRHTLME